MKPNRLRVSVVVALVVLAVGCKRSSEKQQSATEAHPPIARTAARALQVAPGGELFGFVGAIQKPDDPGAPEEVFLGELNLVTKASAAARKVGAGVSTLDDGYRFSPDGQYVAFNAGYRFKEGVGILTLVKLPDGEPQRLSIGCRYYQFSSDGKVLGYVAGGQMKLRTLATGEERTLSDRAASFDFSKDGSRVLIRRNAASGGELLLAAGTAPPLVVGAGVGDYAFSADGSSYAFTARGLKLETMGEPLDPSSPMALYVAWQKQPPKVYAPVANSFDFSPDGDLVAFVAGQDQRHALGDLMVIPVTGGEAKQLASSVFEYRWSPDGKAIAIRESNESKKGARWMTLRLFSFPGAKERLKAVGAEGFKFESYSFSGDGATFAYLAPAAVGSVDLFAIDVAGVQEPQRLAAGVFGYQFAEGNRELWYRTGCIRSGRECDLMAVAVDGGAPRQVLTGIWNYRPSEDGSRLLISYPRYDVEAAADLGWIDIRAKRGSQGLDAYTLLGARFLDPKGTHVAYIVIDPKREGVHLVKLD